MPNKKKSPTEELPYDHALEALLQYIDGNVGDQRPLIAIADQVLAAAPASFHGERDIPNVFEAVVARVPSTRTNAADVAKAIDMMVNEEPGVEGRHAYSVLVGSVTDATLVGAALMYRLLKGAR